MKSLDICFCLGCDANVFSKYFKVGQLSLIPLRLTASSLFLQIPGLEGLGLEITADHQIEDSFLPLAQPLLPAGAHADVQIKLLLDNNLTLEDVDCASVPYSAYQSPVSQHFQLLSLHRANLVPEAEVETFFRTRQEELRLMFNSSDFSLSFRRPGRIALCYCGELDESNTACSGAVGFWKLLLHFTVRGPKVAEDLSPTQEWTVSQGVLFSMRISGWGLLGSDAIQVLSPGSSCDRPDLAENILVGCPSNCQQQNETEPPHDSWTKCWPTSLFFRLIR